jgi:hypothetical protein
MAFFCPRRLAMFIAHAFSHDHFCTRVSRSARPAPSLGGALQMGVGIGRNLITIGGKSQNPPSDTSLPQMGHAQKSRPAHSRKSGYDREARLGAARLGFES